MRVRQMLAWAAVVVFLGGAVVACRAEPIGHSPKTPDKPAPGKPVGGDAAKTPVKAEPTDAPAPPKTPALPTVAILDYETGTTDNTDFGKQIADLLTVRLSVEDGFELVERAKLDRILQEQKLKLTGLADQEKAVEVGKLLGAQLMIIGKTFTMDKHLIFVTKVVGVETGRVKGAISKAEPTKDMSEAILKMSEGVAELIRTQGAKLLPDGASQPDPVAEIRKALGDRTPATVAVIIPEQHVTRRVVDPAVETEIKSVLVACGFKVVDTGMNDLADWAKKLMKGEQAPWPAATRDADVIVVGEAFSEFALRTGDLVTCTARAEINAIDRHSGRILLADRATQRAVDLSELTAGKTALQKAGRKLALAIARTLVTYERKGAAPQEADPTLMPAQGPIDQTGRAVARRRSTASGASVSTPAAAPGGKAVSRTLFAVPLENETADEQYDPAASGLGDLVAVLLAQQKNVTVVERQRLLALAEEQANALKGLTGQTYAVAAGKLLKADTVLVGRLYRVQDKLTVGLQAIDIASERVLAADQMAFRPTDLMETALQLARRLGEQMALPLPQVDLKAIDASPIASLHFAKALSHYYAGNMDAAIMQFMRTVDLDPDYTEAHFWCGMSHQRLGEHAHAAIEWETYLRRHPQGDRSDAVRKLLAEAKRLDAQASPERLGPQVPAKPAPQVETAPAVAAPAPKAEEAGDYEGSPLPWNTADFAFQKRQDGRLEVIALEHRRVEATDAAGSGYYACRVVRSTSGDARTWSSPEVIVDYGKDPYIRAICASHSLGRSAALVTGGYGTHHGYRAEVLGEQEDGTWRKSGMVPGLPPGMASMASHPRWGHLIVSRLPRRTDWAAHPAFGPYVLRGPGLDPLLSCPVSADLAAPNEGAADRGKESP